MGQKQNNSIQNTLTNHFKQNISKVVKEHEIDVENKEVMNKIRNKRRPTASNHNYDDFIESLNQEVLDRFKKQKSQVRQPQFSKQSSIMGVLIPLSQIESPKKGQMSSRQKKEECESKSSILAQLKEKLQVKTNLLSTSIGNIYGKGPSFEYPVIKFSPTSPSRMQKLEIAELIHNQTVNKSPSKWKLLGDVITNKFNQKMPIKEMIESTQMKDKVFDKIYSKLSLGKKLKRYDLYMSEEVGRKELKQLKQVVFENSDQNNQSFKNTKKFKQLQIQQQLASLSKKAAQQEQEEKQATQSYMQTKKSKNHQFLAIKQAVDNKEITLDEANEIIYQHSRQTNDQLFKSVQDSKQGFDSLIKQFKMKQQIKSVSRDVSKVNKSPTQRSESNFHSSHNKQRKLRPQSAVQPNGNLKRLKVESNNQPSQQKTTNEQLNRQKQIQKLKRQSQSQSMIDLPNHKQQRSRSPSNQQNTSSQQIVNINVINQDITNTVVKYYQSGMQKQKRVRPKSSCDLNFKQKQHQKVNKYTNKSLCLSQDRTKPQIKNYSSSNRKYLYKDWRQYLYSGVDNQITNFSINNFEPQSFNSSTNKLSTIKLNQSPQQQRKVYERIGKSQLMQKLFYYPQQDPSHLNINSNQQLQLQQQYSTEVKAKVMDSFDFINSDFDRLKVKSNLLNINSNMNNQKNISHPISHNNQHQFMINLTTTNQTQFDTNHSQSNFDNLRSDSLNFGMQGIENNTTGLSQFAINYRQRKGSNSLNDFNSTQQDNSPNRGANMQIIQHD